MENNHFLHYFRDYAKFIIAHPTLLHEQISELSLESYPKLEPKLIGINEKSQKEEKGRIVDTCHSFLVFAAKGKAETEICRNLKKLKEDNFKSIKEKAHHIFLFIRNYSIHKELLLKILPSYTQKVETAINITLEMSRFNNYLTEMGFRFYDELKKEEVFQEKELISSLIENTVNGVMAFNTKLQITEVNDVFCDAFKLKRGNIVGKNVFDILPFYRDTDVGLAIKGALTGVQVYISERSFVHGKGYYEANINPINDSEGKIMGGVIITYETTHRKNSEEALKKTNLELTEQQRENFRVNDLLNQVMESVPSLIFLYDIRQNKTIYTNKKIEEITGYKLEELQENSKDLIGKIIVPEDVGGKLINDDFSRFDIYKNLDPHGFLDSNFKIKHKNGHLRWLRTKSQVFEFAHDGTPLQILGIAEDITELKESQQTITKARDYYLKILKDFPVLVWRTDKDGNCNFFNNSWLNFTGRAMEQELKDSWQEGVHPDDLAACLNVYKRSFAKRKPFNREYRLRRFDGTYHYFIDTGTPIFDLDGEFTGYVGACMDIQDRKDNEILIQKKNKALAAANQELIIVQEKLSQSKLELEKRIKERTVNLVAREEQIRTITDALPVLIAYFDKDQNCKFINKAIENYLQLSRKEIIGKPLPHILQPSSYPLLKPRIDKVLEGETLNFEFKAEHPTMGTLYFNIDLIPDQTRKEVVGFYGLVYNITERKKAAQTMEKLYEEVSTRNKSLQRINTVLDNFVYTASHDLKSPVHNLEGLLQLLKEAKTEKNFKEEEQVMEMLSIAAHRLKKTIQDLIKVTKLQQQFDVPEHKKASIPAVYESAKSDLQSLITESKATIIEHFQVEEIYYPESHLRSIIYNLLSNALKYRKPDISPLIHIETLAKDSQVLLKVKDNGIGINLEQKQQLFKPFNRLHPETEGTGIGLFSIKRIVEINGDTIDVDSKVGKGSEFTVYFNPR